MRAGGNFFSGIPSMIAAMPAVLGALGNGAVDLNRATGEAELLAVQYAWTWAEYHAQVALGRLPAEKQAELDRITADLARLYDEDVGPVAAAVNNGVEGFLGNVLAYKGRADAAGARGDVRALITQTAETVEVASQVVIEEITGQAVLAWMARAARSERVATALARARERLNVEEVRKLEGATDEMRAAQVNPRVEQASPALRGVSPGTPVSAGAGDPRLGDRPGLGREPATPHRRGWPPDHGRDPLAGRRDPRVARDDARHDPEAGDGQAEERQPGRLQLPGLSLRRDRLHARRHPQPG